MTNDAKTTSTLHDAAASPHEMHGHAPKSASDTWVFNAEATSTLLIAAWYVFGVLIALKVIPDNGFYHWGNTWVIPFLLGIFYLGAGYLFQRYQTVTGFSQWRTYMRREFIVLLTPFLAFTLLTLATGSLVATQPGIAEAGLAAGAHSLSLEGLLDALFVHPVGPVGYFIVLLAFFIVGRTPKTMRGMGLLLAASVVVKVCAIVLSDIGLADGLPYYLDQIMGNWIWFVLGIALRFFRLDAHLAKPSVAIGATLGFVAAGALLFAFDVGEAACLSGLTFLGLACFYSVAAAHFMDGPQDRFFGFVTQYTMAIWLMHEMLAQIAFCGLFALGVSPAGAFAMDGGWSIVCAACCLVACYPLPVLVMTLLSHIWKLGFIVYPSRYLPKSL